MGRYIRKPKKEVFRTGLGLLERTKIVHYIPMIVNEKDLIEHIRRALT